MANSLRSNNKSTFLILSNQKRQKLPARFRADDVRYTESLVEYFLKCYTRPGAKVLDPFAGFGTTLLVAEKMGRHAYGIEYDADRAEYIKSLLKRPERLIHGDSRKIQKFSIPKIDFCMTSPPYTARGEPQNPFSSYSSRGKGYDAYLRDLTSIYKQISGLMKTRSTIVIEVSNIKGKDRRVTTLAWDIASALSKLFTFEGEIIVGWKSGYGYGYDHSYCLVFRVR